MKIDIARVRRHIERLATFTATPGAGTTRLSYTPEYRLACDYLADHLRPLGVVSRLDAIGNLRMVLAGTAQDAPRVVIGSHLDSVINGGDFDGILGVVAGVEVIESLVRHRRRPRASLEVVSFVEEEGTTFRCPLAGSKALAGELDVDDIKHLYSESGQSLYDAAREFGLEPWNLPRDRYPPGAVAAMLELHIEQGAVLESLGMAVGIVDTIAGSQNLRVRLGGRANHAGTTPMTLRFDALACAAECISAVERVASDATRPHTVATVGRIHCRPNAVNVIPAHVEFSIDVRDVASSAIASSARTILGEIEAIAGRRRIGVEWELTGESPPRPMSPAITGILERLSSARRLDCHRMTSGALHDAAMMTLLTEVGMIFVPSRDGRSHTPKEWTDYEDIEQGVSLLLDAVVELTGA